MKKHRRRSPYGAEQTDETEEFAPDVVKKSVGHGGFAIGTGNSIPNYLPAESYLNMVEIVREYRGDWTHR